MALSVNEGSNGNGLGNRPLAQYARPTTDRAWALQFRRPEPSDETEEDPAFFVYNCRNLNEQPADARSVGRGISPLHLSLIRDGEASGTARRVRASRDPFLSGNRPV